MAGRKLVANVYVNGVLYPSGSSPEKAIAERITNPKVWGGKDSAADDAAADDAAADDAAAADVDAPAFPEGDPSEDWTAKQLKAYADSKEIDVSAGKNKAEIVDILGKA